MESKKHYKLYKSGKQWKTLAITAAVAIAGVVSFDNATANADVASSAIATTEVSQTTNDSSAVQSDATSATVVVASINSTEVSSTASAASSETVVAPVSAESVSVSAVASSATSSASSVTQSTAAVATEASSAISATSAVSSSVATTTSEATVSATSSMNDSNLSDATSTQDSAASSAAEIRAVAAAVSSTKNGWVNENGTYTYYTNGKVASGESYSYLPTINGTGHNWYLVKDGVVQSGVQQWYGSYYYFNPTNYLKLDHQDYVQSQWGSWYMVGSDGIVKSGVQKWYGKYYYFDPVTYLKLDHQDYVKSQWGDWYMVGSDGIVQSGLVQWYGHYYYFNPVTYLKATNTTFSYNGISLTADNTGIITGTTTSSQFLLKIYQATLDGWKEYGVLPSVTAAQAILESGWGQSALATEANNLFGIKGSYNGQYVIMSTAEYGSGGYYYVNAEFRKYPSFYESVVDHGYFLYSNSRYSNLLHQTSYATVTSLLQSDGYATSPTYASSLNNVITTYGLQSWDTAAGV